MLAALDLAELSPAALLVVAVLVLWVLSRVPGWAAHLALWIKERIHGPEELYGERTPAGSPVGRRGTARTDCAPRGKVFVRGELWDAEAERPVAAGETVTVVGAEGLVLRVRPTLDADRR